MSDDPADRDVEGADRDPSAPADAAGVPFELLPFELVEVRLLQLPVDILRQAQEHADSLLREFALISASTPADRRGLPVRLLTLVEELRTQFGDYSAGSNEQVAAATQAGLRAVDLVLPLPVIARDASRRLGELLDEADRYCASGALLTLVTPPQPLQLRHWYLGQVIDQLDGGPAIPWPEWSARQTPNATLAAD